MALVKCLKEMRQNRAIFGTKTLNLELLNRRKALNGLNRVKRLNVFHLTSAFL
jgi:hypothetical protein